MTSLPSGPPRCEAIDGLDAPTLYRLLQLRVDVFVVEQHCAYRELDDHDLDPGTHHWWYEDSHGPLAYLRTLSRPEGLHQIGRVVTRPTARHAGLAGQLIEAALGSLGRPVHLEAQSHLVQWYRRFGFEPSGTEYIEDGIAHTPMTLES